MKIVDDGTPASFECRICGTHLLTENEEKMLTECPKCRNTMYVTLSGMVLQVGRQ